MFIYSFVMGSALSQITAIINQPKELLRLLGVSAPQQATFFMTYIMIGVRARHSSGAIPCIWSKISCSTL